MHRQGLDKGPEGTSQGEGDKPKRLQKDLERVSNLELDLKPNIDSRMSDLDIALVDLLYF